MKYLLILQADASREDHDRFRRIAGEAGELITGHTLADPATAELVGRAEVTAIRGYYLVDVETPDRAVELARVLPDPAIEVRPVMFTACVDY
ncbi:hypothetical protein FB561_0186 [Kribbella amoyensis]|uniref:YCII-related domain-containing protein n=1 Tax=Kribbella amoyensis TaxID=996641 RepID=A0A561BJT4_9ACTN|nr:hypothetical protein [Kribbella amoyensis]TWD79131.1 hypothetical protein FB561_0186 [Kribbella amoyensis]